MPDYTRMTRTPQLAQLVSELLARPSVSSENAPFDMPNEAVIDLLASWLDDLGFDCERMPVPDRPGKFNLIAVRGRGPGGLVLAGHSDTVPFDEHGWHSDPFKLSERDGNWYGLGVCDMKGFLALAVETAAEFADRELQQPLIILATADEESTMDGAKALAAAGRPKARYAVIGEPTGLKPVRMHKGILMDSIHVHGKTGHSSRPDLGANAIDGLHDVLRALSAYRETLKSRLGTARGFALDHPTLNLGSVQGGDSANRIPGHVELQIDMRFPPGFEIEALRAEARAEASAGLQTPGCRLEFANLMDGVPAFQTPETSELVRVCEELTGPPAGVVDFATEGGFFNQLGLDTVILGPGDIEVAHQQNEYLPLDRIEPMRNTLRRLVERFCL